MSEWIQCLTHTQNVDWGFLLSTTLPTSGVATQSHYIQMSSQGVMSSKKVSNDPGLCPVKGQMSDLIRLIKVEWFVSYCHSHLRTNLNSNFRIYENSISNYWTPSILTHCGRVTQICVFNTVKLGTSAILLSATPQGGMFPEVSHPQALLGSLVSTSWKFQFTKIVSEFVINF